MLRKIICIDEDSCTGCGLCVTACHEGAIALVDGKARLIRDDYCDGLGDCLPACPEGAISFEEREAAAYDEQAVLERSGRTQDKQPAAPTTRPSGCPGSRAQALAREQTGKGAPNTARVSELTQWPVQIKLASPQAAYFRDADVLIAADCTAFAYGDFHRDFIRDHVVLIGCPKLDAGDYSEKLTAIFAVNPPRSVTVVRMEVPCCAGIEAAATRAIENSGCTPHFETVTIGLDGRIVERSA
ncbi:MAG: 4Fe-4S binding protein [Raoultibacter sp.]